MSIPRWFTVLPGDPEFHRCYIGIGPLQWTLSVHVRRGLQLPAVRFTWHPTIADLTREIAKSKRKIARLDREIARLDPDLR